MLESGMTAEAIRERADTFYKHQVNKAQIGHQRALETFLASLPSTLHHTSQKRLPAAPTPVSHHEFTQSSLGNGTPQ
jgi:hypothetical protein